MLEADLVINYMLKAPLIILVWLRHSRPFCRRRKRHANAGDTYS